MRRNTLDALPRDCFSYKIAELPRPRRQNLWGFLVVFLLLVMFVPSIVASGEFPGYVALCGILWLGLCALYILLCILYSAAGGGMAFYIFMTLYAMGLLLLWLWLVVSQLSIILCSAFQPLKMAVVFSLSLAALLGGVLACVLVCFRVKRRVAQGHYRKGGKGLGFWNSPDLKHSLLRTLAAVAPASLAFSGAAILLGAALNVTWDAAYIPVVALLAPLFWGVACFPFAYGGAIGMLRIYYIRRFGAA